jgi:hypothetical protein
MNARIFPMKRLFLLMIAAALVWANGAVACDGIHAVRAVKAAATVSECSGKIVELTVLPMPELSEIVELTRVPDIARLTELALTATAVALEAADWEATVTVESEVPVKGTIVLTVVKALGKALLKVIATMIHEVV